MNVEQSGPHQPLSKTSRWSTRRLLLWALAVVILGGALFYGFVVVLVTTLLRSSDVYKDAVARVTASPAVQLQLGNPVRSKWRAGGQVATQLGGYGHAHLEIPIYGPKGEATIIAESYKVDGVWTYRRLEVLIPDQPQIVLVAPPERER
jgi:hypothetical protein